MLKKIFLISLFPIFVFAQNPSVADLQRWQNTAKKVQITRDYWGVPHIEAETDAHAVFGLLYAQCEDDFQRVELNYIEKLGRLSEIKGEEYLNNDLQIRLLIDQDEAKKEYKNAEPWFKALLDAFADGINFYIYKHPNTKPVLISKFEPWFPLLWTDGSIGAISTADLGIKNLKEFYNDKGFSVGAIKKPLNEEYQQTGSNGFAIAPALSSSGNAMLYINPHTTFYFRPEVHVKSKQGLNVYGAVTWGQFFVYQGFNEYCGWMHTSSNADVADTYLEKVIEKDGKYYYEYDKNLRPFLSKKIAIKYLKDGQILTKEFITYNSHHGPVMGKMADNWISLKHYNRSELSLKQSWIRTKAKGLADYKKAMDLKANTSNNTVFADKDGNIAYWHGNYMPIRDSTLNWSKPQDGSISATEYKGLHEVDETVHVYNPKEGWIQNCNSTPFTSAGKDSPKKEAYPAYMAPDGENFRGLNAVKLLNKAENLDLEKLIALGYDNYLTAFEILIPGLIKAGKNNKDEETAEVLAILAKWDYRVNAGSVEATIAIEWAQRLSAAIRKVYVDQGESDQIQNTKKFIETASESQLMEPLAEVIKKLKNDHGSWQVAWGEINRFQRISNKIDSEFDDSAFSFPVGNASALWGCLPSFNSRYSGNSIKRYGYSGNSFVCAVEFGDKIKAKSLLAGGNSGNLLSKNFNDQAEMYAAGQFKEVLFYPEDLKKFITKVYRPGE